MTIFGLREVSPRQAITPGRNIGGGDRAKVDVVHSGRWGGKRAETERARIDYLNIKRVGHLVKVART